MNVPDDVRRNSYTAGREPGLHLKGLRKPHKSVELTRVEIYRNKFHTTSLRWRAVAYLTNGDVVVSPTTHTNQLAALDAIDAAVKKALAA